MFTDPGGDRRRTRGRRLTDGTFTPRALVIDPHHDTCELLQYCLETAGFTVATTSDGTEGYIHAAAHVPDLITTELAPPGDTEFDLLRRLRRNMLTTDIP